MGGFKKTNQGELDTEKLDKKIGNFVKSFQEKQSPKQQYAALKSVYKACKSDAKKRKMFHMDYIRNVTETFKLSIELLAEKYRERTHTKSYQCNVIEVLDAWSEF